MNVSAPMRGENDGGSSRLPSSLDSPDTLVRSKELRRYPPEEIDVVKKRPLALYKSGKDQNSNNKSGNGILGSSNRSNRSNCWSSGTSIASSITFHDELADIVKAEPGVVEAQFDSKPDKPQRQGSYGTSLGACEETEEDGEDETVRDSPPNQPRRRLSLASVASSITGTTTTTKSKNSARTEYNHSARRSRKQKSNTASSSSQSMPDLSPPLFSVEKHVDWQQLAQKAAKFQAIIKVKDRKYAMRNYRNCFVGSEAVDTMIEYGLVKTREEAVALGRDLVQYFNLFHHVTKGHAFEDKQLFYRFLINEPSHRVSDDGHSSHRPWFAFRRTRTIQEESTL